MAALADPIGGWHLSRHGLSRQLEGAHNSCVCVRTHRNQGVERLSEGAGQEEGPWVLRPSTTTYQLYHMTVTARFSRDEVSIQDASIGCVLYSMGLVQVGMKNGHSSALLEKKNTTTKIISLCNQLVSRELIL